jgi:hypothetical protein
LKRACGGEEKLFHAKTMKTVERRTMGEAPKEKKGFWIFGGEK